MTETVRDPVDVRRSTRRWQIAGVWVFLVLVLSFPAYRLTESSRRSDAEVSRKRRADRSRSTALERELCNVPRHDGRRHHGACAELARVPRLGH